MFQGAKCPLFYMEQNYKTNIYPKENARLLHKSEISFAHLSQKAFIKLDCVLSQSFTPTCQYFYTDKSVISVPFCITEKRMLMQSTRNTSQIRCQQQTDICLETQSSWSPEYVFHLM